MCLGGGVVIMVMVVWSWWVSFGGGVGFFWRVRVFEGMRGGGGGGVGGCGFSGSIGRFCKDGDIFWWRMNGVLSVMGKYRFSIMGIEEYFVFIFGGWERFLLMISVLGRLDYGFWS